MRLRKESNIGAERGRRRPVELSHLNKSQRGVDAKTERTAEGALESKEQRLAGQEPLVSGSGGETA